MAKSAGVVFARVLVALIILAGIGACIYFFLIKNDNVRGAVHEEMSKLLASDEQKTLNTNLGELESGTYFEYNKNVSNQGYSELYLTYYMDNEILDTYANLLMYVGNKDNAKATEIQNDIKSYQTSLTQALRSQSLFNQTYNQLDTTNPATVQNFKSLIIDFQGLVKNYHKLTKDTFDYVTSYFYKNIDAKQSQKYVQTYGLSVEAELLKTAVLGGDEVSVALYKDSLAMAKFYTQSKSAHFTAQSNDTQIAKFITVFSAKDKDYSAFLNSTDKADYYNKITDTVEKERIYLLLTGFGLVGRL